MPKIVPKSKAPGADFCGVDKYYYIVRSDLDCYMRSTNFNHGNDLEVFSLHNSCQGGDHYLAHEDGLFYIIKGDHYRRVSNMNKDDNAVVYSLHPNCQGGDHYLSAFGRFYIIFQGRGIYHRVTNMNTDEDAIEYTLHPDCQNGLYYWGTKDYYYFVKPHDEWGIQYFRCTDFHRNLDAVTYSFHGSVVAFIPGGLAINEGPAFGRWEAIKTISNDSDSPIEWNKKITKKVGCKKMKMSSVEQNWKINMKASYESGGLAEAIAKYQFSLSVEYGGRAVQTQQEDWSEATEVEESIHVTLQPESQMYIWQYRLGFGNEPVLFCRDMKFTNDSTPPTSVPLPPSNE
ncbi:PREDICTED: uncharacterized protein LOC107117777 [Gekko japonicus]|uniref:Uncharacterized protein LOC107117777 n=1 Tax=Gekko japonicus TaxID=146911 RepID=A0ABM1KNZ3_GEKJA|nr:PREDICTED: uncharacterized protein LOC107117777 [Gekko japonicus]XP_015275429.1 PREDICTED: uncharacterized protein LOC107117777 [Gekko japonicus]XP_015275430.1 PREDICTED: uncharacterized protein LOC107117777 [Gekko japonicus]